MSSPSPETRSFLFLIASARTHGNSEQLAECAAASLPAEVSQQWLNLAELNLPAFVDSRHAGDGVYPAPIGSLKTLLDATLAATDIVLAAPLYWYSMPASAKLYLDHWSGWLRVPGLNFKTRMSGKTMWALSSFSDQDPKVAQPLFDSLRFSAEYMGMRWGGGLLGRGNRPGDVLNDFETLAQAERLLTSPTAPDHNLERIALR